LVNDIKSGSSGNADAEKSLQKMIDLLSKLKQEIVSKPADE